MTLQTMKTRHTLVLLFTLVYSSIAVQAQRDTLTNLPDGTALYAPQYDNAGQWGYLLGQNHLYRQQFAEKYTIEGQVTLHGIIAHLAGTYENENNFVEFNVYSVGASKLPDRKLASVQRLYKDLMLDGSEYYVPLVAPIVVADSFYVTFNVQDYMHGGYDGDTLGLYCGVAGSRSDDDLRKFGRNAVQAHNHTVEDWKDFYTQNFSPIATHFALFPVVEKYVVTSLDRNEEGEKYISVFPNPASTVVTITVKGRLPEDAHIEILDLSGKVMRSKLYSTCCDNERTERWDISSLAKGLYIIEAITPSGSFRSKFIKE